MVALVREGPRIAETQVDGKKQLQYTLRVQCEMLIMHVTRQVVEPLLTFITKVTAFRAQGVKAPGPLRQQVFMGVRGGCVHHALMWKWDQCT